MKSGKCSIVSNKPFFCAAVFFIAVSVFSSARAVDEYQYRVLFSPTTEILQAEARGSVMIYDGLRYATVARAMDEQFERIESMMFVGTIIESADGEFEVEEDGCD